MAACSLASRRPPSPAGPPARTLLLQTFPWLRVVISLREPIGRALSMQAHMADKHGEGCLTSST